MNKEKEQCEGCLTYTAKPLTLLCETCADKAASYDLTAYELKQLSVAVSKSLQLLNSLKNCSMDELPRIIGEIYGTLSTALYYTTEKGNPYIKKEKNENKGSHNLQV